MFWYIFVVEYPKSCSQECRCYTDRQARTLVGDCSRSGLAQIPPSLPDDLDWLILFKNNITDFGKNFRELPFLHHISTLDVRENVLMKISPDFIELFINSSKLASLDISSNKLATLPMNIRNITSLNNLSLSGNNFICNCDNIWMKDWILNKSQIIHNYKIVTCQLPSGTRSPVIQISKVDLGCIPTTGPFALWKILGIAIIKFFETTLILMINIGINITHDISLSLLFSHRCLCGFNRSINRACH